SNCVRRSISQVLKSFGATATIRRLSSMIAALSSASSAFESCACNRETSLLAARNGLAAHKTRKLNTSIRAEMHHLGHLRLAFSINFRLNSVSRDSSVIGSKPDRHYVPSIHAATRANFDVDQHRLCSGVE